MHASRSWARFDDLTVGSALEFPEVEQVLVASEPGEVAGVLDDVERRTAAEHGRSEDLALVNSLRGPRTATLAGRTAARPTARAG